MPNKNLHSWERKEPQRQESPHHSKLFEIVQTLAEVSTSVEHLEESGRQTRSDLKNEAAMIKSLIEKLAENIEKDFVRHDTRLDAIELHLAKQDAEAAGFRRALRWGAGALTALGSALGWMAATWGESLLSALGSGGAATGGK